MKSYNITWFIHLGTGSIHLIGITREDHLLMCDQNTLAEFVSIRPIVWAQGVTVVLISGYASELIPILLLRTTIIEFE